jgi:hypothetical protein
MIIKTKQPGIFLSHSHADKEFARRLEEDLTKAGVRVWIDDAEILLGDSLIEKIREGIDDMDYLGVILSPQSVASEWVKKEVEIAMNEEIDGKRIKVLPLLHQQCEFPGFLKGKKYADFSSEDKYVNSLKLVLRRLGPTSPDATLDKEQRLNTLRASYPLLAAAFDEVQGEGISKATNAAILSSAIPSEDLSDFWSLIAERTQGWKLYGVASVTLQCLDKFGIGHDVIDYCLEEGRMDSNQKTSLGMLMSNVTSRSAVVWCHARMISKIKSDDYYNSFIHKHISVILEECRQAMLGYLLYPNRGPGSYNIDTFYDVIMQMDNPQPLVIRWIDWLNAGCFDGNNREGDESADPLYKIFNEVINKKTDKLNTIVEETLNRVYLLLKIGKEQYKGLYHLVAMLTGRYKGADYVLNNIMSGVQTRNFSSEETSLFFLLWKAFQSLVKLNEAPDDRALQDEVNDRWLEVAKIDKVTGYWLGSKRFQNEE